MSYLIQLEDSQGQSFYLVKGPGAAWRKKTPEASIHIKFARKYGTLAGASRIMRDCLCFDPWVRGTVIELSQAILETKWVSRQEEELDHAGDRS